MRIGKNVNAVTKGNCLSGCINKSREVCIVVAPYVIYFCVCSIRAELSACCNLFELSHKVNTT